MGFPSHLNNANEKTAMNSSGTIERGRIQVAHFGALRIRAWAILAASPNPGEEG